MGGDEDTIIVDTMLFGRVMVIRRSRWRMGFEVVARSEQGALSAVECGAHPVEKSMEVVQQSIKLSNLCLELRYRTLFREKDTNPVRKSTKSMRANGGYGVIKKATGKVEKKHIQHIAAYGEVNERRLTDKHETANFKWGVANRGA
ncbi:hypothetical protein Tco_0982272 [Tanacetum coccineum]